MELCCPKTILATIEMTNNGLAQNEKTGIRSLLN